MASILYLYIVMGTKRYKSKRSTRKRNKRNTRKRGGELEQIMMSWSNQDKNQFRKSQNDPHGLKVLHKSMHPTKKSSMFNSFPSLSSFPSLPSFPFYSRRSNNTITTLKTRSNSIPNSSQKESNDFMKIVKDPVQDPLQVTVQAPVSNQNYNDEEYVKEYIKLKGPVKNNDMEAWPMSKYIQEAYSDEPQYAGHSIMHAKKRRKEFMNNLKSGKM